MTLATLISIADKRLPMVLYTDLSADENSKKGARYNFVEKRWDGTNVTIDKIITIGEFRDSDVYKRVRTCDMITFATMPTRGISTIPDEYKLTHPMVVSISIKSPYAMNSYKSK